MGLFTGLAIGGLIALNAAQALKKKPPTPLAPAPITPLAPPEPPTVLPGAQQAEADKAGLKQRKKAAAGSFLTRPPTPISGVLPVAGRATPRSLIGGY